MRKVGVNALDTPELSRPHIDSQDYGDYFGSKPLKPAQIDLPLFPGVTTPPNFFSTF